MDSQMNRQRDNSNFIGPSVGQGSKNRALYKSILQGGRNFKPGLNFKH